MRPYYAHRKSLCYKSHLNIQTMNTKASICWLSLMSEILVYWGIQIAAAHALNIHPLQLQMAVWGILIEATRAVRINPLELHIAVWSILIGKKYAINIHPRCRSRWRSAASSSQQHMLLGFTSWSFGWRPYLNRSRTCG